MKRIYLLFTCLMLSLFIACNDDEPEPEVVETEITDEESAELVGNTVASEVMSLSANQGGIGISSLDAASGGRVNAALECGVTAEESFTNNYERGNFLISYATQYTRTLTCLRSIPIQLDASFTATSMAESVRLSYTRSSSGTSVLTIDPDNLSNVLWNGQVQGSSQLTLKRDESRSFVTSSNLTVTDLSVNVTFIRSILAQSTPSGNLIASGSATYSGTVTNGEGANRTVEASITFNGDGTADIVINGQTYVVDLDSGQLI